MEKRNWDDFRFVSLGRDSLYGDDHYPVDSLQPGLFVNIFTTYTDISAAEQTYRQFLRLIGDSLLYRRSRNLIRDREKVLGEFLVKMENPQEKNVRCALNDKYCSGRNATDTEPEFIGGLGSASIDIDQRKYTGDEWAAAETEYYECLKKGFTSPLPYLSYMNIRMPPDKFTDGQSFLDWVLSLGLMHSPSLFSASAGYCIESYSHGHGMNGLWGKTREILAACPGFESSVMSGESSLGCIYSEKHRILKPHASRINWLNAMGENALLFYPGGFESLRNDASQFQGLTVHKLPYGFMVQAGSEPGTGEEGRAPAAYYEAGILLEMYASLMLPLDTVESDIGWAEHFHTPETLEKIHERAMRRMSIIMS